MSIRRATPQSRMSRHWERARTEPGLLRNLIAIAVMVLLGTAAAGYFLSKERFNPPWEDKYSVYATFEESAAISPGKGQEVRIFGVSVGDIRSASVSEDGLALVEMKIESKYPVYDNAIAVLRPKSVLNEMYVELNPGAPPGRKLVEGDVLPVANTQSPIQVNEVLDHLDVNARAALTTLLSEADIALAHAPAELPAGLREADAVLADLQPVMAEMQTRRATLAQLVTALAKISTAVGDNDERLSGLAESLQRTLASVAGNSESFDASLGQLPELSNRLRGATDAVTELAGELDPTLDNVRAASDELPDALSRFNSSVGQLDTTLDVAAPVLDKARPVVADLRPAVGDLNRALEDLRPITQRLEPITSGLLPYLTDLQAFVYQTNSVFSLTDVNRGILRGQVLATPDTLPLGLPDRSAPTPR